MVQAFCKSTEVDVEGHPCNGQLKFTSSENLVDSMCNLLSADCQLTLRMMVIEVNVVEELIVSTFGTWVALGGSVPAHTSVNWNGIVALNHSPY